MTTRVREAIPGVGQLRRLAEFPARDELVVSLYLNVDGREFPRKSDYEAKLPPLVRGAIKDLRKRSIPKKVLSQALADVEAAANHVKKNFRRGSTKGIAVFASSPRGLFDAFLLPQAPRDRMVVNHAPMIRPLNALLSEYHRYGLVMVNRKTARLFLFYMGELEECEGELVDDVHGRHEQGGWSQARFSRHIEAEVARHLKRTAARANAAFARAGAEKILIGAQRDIAGEFAKALLPDVRKKVVGELSIRQDASASEIKSALAARESEIEEADDDRLVDELRSLVGQGRASAGLAGVLASLSQGRLETLLVSRGFTAPGWRCPACGWLAAVGPTCPTCESPMTRVDDIVEEAVEESVATGRQAELVTGNGDLDVMGRIGALLRY